MTEPACPARRAFLRGCAAAASLAPLACAHGAEANGATDVSETDPAAIAVHYVEDAARAKDAQPGADCSNCVQYKGAPNAPRGTCKLFGGKLVKSGGWCSAWSDL